MDVLYQLSYIGLFSGHILHVPNSYRDAGGSGLIPLMAPFRAVLERKTGLEPATYSLEGYRSTK